MKNFCFFRGILRKKRRNSDYNNFFRNSRGLLWQRPSTSSGTPSFVLGTQNYHFANAQCTVACLARNCTKHPHSAHVI